MKKLICLLLLLASVACNNQDNDIEAQLIDELLAQAGVKMGTEPALATEYFHQAEAKLTAQNSSSKKLTYVYKALAYLYHEQGNSLKAAEYINTALSQPNLTTKDLSELYFYYGQLQANNGAYAQAAEYFKQAQVFFSQVGNHEYQARSYHELGNCYRSLNQFETSKESYNTAIKLTSDVGLQANFNNSLGNLFAKQEDYPKAIEYYKKALALG